MPTSRRTASMFLQTFVSSTPSMVICPLVIFQAIDAPDHGRFARPRRAAHDAGSPRATDQIDALQHMKFAKPLIDIHKTDNGTNGRIRLNR